MATTFTITSCCYTFCTHRAKEASAAATAAVSASTQTMATSYPYRHCVVCPNEVCGIDVGLNAMIAFVELLSKSIEILQHINGHCAVVCAYFVALPMSRFIRALVGVCVVLRILTLHHHQRAQQHVQVRDMLVSLSLSVCLSIITARLHCRQSTHSSAHQC